MPIFLTKFWKFCKDFAAPEKKSLEFVDFRADFYGNLNFMKCCRINKNYQILAENCENLWDLRYISLFLTLLLVQLLRKNTVSIHQIIGEMSMKERILKMQSNSACCRCAWVMKHFSFACLLSIQLLIHRECNCDIRVSELLRRDSSFDSWYRNNFGTRSLPKRDRISQLLVRDPTMSGPKTRPFKNHLKNHLKTI